MLAKHLLGFVERVSFASSTMQEVVEVIPRPGLGCPPGSGHGQLSAEASGFSSVLFGPLFGLLHFGERHSVYRYSRDVSDLR